ncbi:MAG: hypothetical protein IKW04_06015 [Clostridia bacterium]|nr:hypothetical protein [Clostridia bacterium]
MKKEFIKTVVLTCLVISSLVLSAHIWHEKELWSSDYNSFVHSLKNFFAGERGEEQGDSLDVQYWSQISPEFVAFTYASQRTVYYHASPGFPEAYRTVSDLLSSIEKNGDLVTITEEEYLNAYKTNSLMLKFPSRVNLQELLGQGDAFFDTVANPISSTLVIGIGDSQSNYLTFLDDSSGHAYRLPVKISATSDQIREQVAGNSQNSSYAFELNFDTNTGGSERMLFDRFVPMVLEAPKVQTLTAEPVAYSSSYDSVFKAFHIVKNSARSYQDKAGVIHFIENRSILNIWEEGAFSFEANDPEAGIGLGGSSEKEAVTEFVNLLYKNIVPESEGYLVVLSHYDEGNQHVYEFMYHTPNGFLYQENQPAVRVVCEGGVIMKYEQTLLSVQTGEPVTMSTGVIEAYDYLYKQPDISDRIKYSIKSMVPCNMLKDGTIAVGWFCQFSDGSVTGFIP